MNSHAEAAAVPLLRGVAATRARVAAGLVFFVNGAAFASWVSRIPVLRANLHLGDGALGSVLFAMAIGVLLSFPLAGKGAQVVGPRPLAFFAGLLVLALLPVPFMIGIVPSLVLVMLEVGAANGAMQVSMNVLALGVQERVGRPIMSSLHGLWSAGGLAGAGLGSLAAHAGVAPALHLAVVAAMLAALLAMAALLLRGVDLQGQPTRDAAPAPAGQRLGGLDRVLAGLGVICFCSFLTEGALADWSAVYLREQAHASESVAALGYAAFAGAMTGMRLVGDRLIARLGAVRLLRAFNVLGAVSLAAALASQRLGAAMLAFVFLGLGLATVVPTTLVAAARHAQARAPGEGAAVQAARAVALMSGFGYSGLLAGPPLIGWLAQATSLPWALGLLAVLVAVIAALVALLNERPRVPAPACADGRLTPGTPAC